MLCKSDKPSIIIIISGVSGTCVGGYVVAHVEDLPGHRSHRPGAVAEGQGTWPQIGRRRHWRWGHALGQRHGSRHACLNVRVGR